MADQQKYIAQWRIEGLGNQPLDAGDPIMLLPEEAEPFLAGGSLKLASKRGRPARDEGTDDGGEEAAAIAAQAQAQVLADAAAQALKERMATARVEWEANAELRAQHQEDLDAYLATVTASVQQEPEQPQ